MERLNSSDMNNLRLHGENALRKTVMERFEELQIRPNENLGQHSLVDEHSVNLLAQSVTPGNMVIEVGSGVGQVTEALAKRASRVISIEIDRRYGPILTRIEQRHPNVQIIFGDAIALKLKDLIPKGKEGEGVQIVASLPFHITEPFLHKIAGLSIKSATLVVGQRLTRAIQASSEENADFGQLTLLAQTFFEIDVLATIKKQKFFPVPRTNAAIIRLTPKEEYEFRSSQRDFLFRRLFLTSKRSPLVKNCLKEGLIEYAQASQMGTLSKREHNRRLRRSVRADLMRLVVEDETSRDSRTLFQKPTTKRDSRQLTQNQARAIIERMGIPGTILNKPFEQLNNAELKILSKALR